MRYKNYELRKTEDHKWEIVQWFPVRAGTELFYCVFVSFFDDADVCPAFSLLLIENILPAQRQQVADSKCCVQSQLNQCVIAQIWMHVFVVVNK